MSKSILLSVLFFVCNYSAFAQIKIDGPKEGTVGYRTIAKLTLDVTDPQIKCFPANNDWIAVQDFSGQKYIDFVPGRKSLAAGEKSKLYTFVVAGNKANKTYLETWEVIISPDGEPPTPDDANRRSTLYKTLLAAYQVAPSGENKAKLIVLLEAHLKDTKDSKYISFREAHEGLKAIAKKYLGDNDLRPLRDAISDYLSTKVSQKGSVWDKDKLVSAMTEIIVAVKALP